MRAVGRVPGDLLSAGQRAVLRELLVRRSAKGGWAFPSMASIASATGFSLRTVAYRIAELRAGGWIEVWNRFAGQRQIASGYRVCMTLVGQASRTVEMVREVVAESCRRSAERLRAAVQRRKRMMAQLCEEIALRYANRAGEVVSFYSNGGADAVPVAERAEKGRIAGYVPVHMRSSHATA